MNKRKLLHYKSWRSNIFKDFCCENEQREMKVPLTDLFVDSCLELKLWSLTAKTQYLALITNAQSARELNSRSIFQQVIYFTQKTMTVIIFLSTCAIPKCKQICQQHI